MERVYLIAGFLCEQLFTDPELKHLLWCDETQLVLGQEGKMRLGPGGEDPGPPDGVPLFIGNTVPYQWGVVRETLQATLSPGTFDVQYFHYDWRKSLRDAGNALHLRIVEEHKPGETVSILAHSAGGLVALNAWQSLNTSGFASWVRRIVTLSTPFQGSYYPTQLLTRTDPEIDRLVQWNNFAFASAIGLTVPAEAVAWDWPSLFNLFATFPAFYELFPSLAGSLFVTDPNRAQLYTASNYPTGFTPSQALLNYAKNVWQPAILNPANRPTSYVMTCVVGRQNTTRVSLSPPLVLDNSASYNDSLSGDGVVEQESATLAPCLRVNVAIDHQSMPSALTAIGLTAQWLLDPRSPPTPPPPPVVVPLVFNQELTDTFPPELFSPGPCIWGG